MGSQRTTFAKLQHEKATKAKAAMKRERRKARALASSSETPAAETPTETHSAITLINRMSALHERYDDGAISFDDFEAEKAELQQRIAVAANM